MMDALPQHEGPASGGLLSSEGAASAAFARARRLLRSSLTRGQRVRERIIEYALLSCGLLSIVVTIGIAGVILFGSYEFFTHDEHKDYTRHAYALMTASDIWERVVYFFTGTEWTGNIPPHKYGILPLLVGTLMVALIAFLVAMPIGLTTAIYLSEYAKPWVRKLAKPVLELLAGIPPVIYGYFAITVVTPFLAERVPGFLDHWGPGFLADWFHGIDNNNNMLSGGFVVGIMIIPMIASLSEDALRAVPRSLRDGAVALGANKFETSIKVVLPAALSGVIASFILAISRAIGETMAVSLACGGRPILNFDPRQGAATMTGFIAQVAQGDTPQGTTVFASLFAVAAVLFFMTLSMNLIAQKVLRRFRQVYQ
jgi:phosphate transport system permease protein